MNNAIVLSTQLEECAHVYISVTTLRSKYETFQALKIPLLSQASQYYPIHPTYNDFYHHGLVLPDLYFLKK